MKNIFTKVNIKRFASYVLVAALASAATWFIAPKTTKLELLATVIENRFILHKGENVIYAARLEVASGALSITQEDLISSFRLITQAWKSGEM